MQPRRGVVPVEQSRVGHDQPDLDADVVGVRLPREALGERVCHHLVARAWITGGDPLRACHKAGAARGQAAVRGGRVVSPKIGR